MTIDQQHFALYAGETKTINIVVVDASGVPVALTGATVLWVVTSAANTVLTRSTGGSGITLTTTTSTNDTITIALSRANTEALEGGYRHECRVTSGGTETVVAVGVMTIYKSTTL